jgi:hypothetical protein
VRRSEREASRGRRVVGWLLAGLSVTYAGFLHHGLGPASDQPAPPWWAPRGFLMEGLADSALAPAVSDAALGIWLFAIPSVVLGIGVFWTSRSAIARALALCCVAASLLFSLYGIAATPHLIWQFFYWRGSLAMVGIALAVGSAAAAPWIARSWLEYGWAIRSVLYAPIFFLVVALVRNATGTDPTLPFSVSPWPAIPVFGLEVAAAGLAVQFGGIAIGLGGLAAARRRSGASAVGLAVGGLLVGLAFPTLSLWIGGSAGMLPFRIDGLRLASAALVCLAGIAVVTVLGGGLWSEALSRRARAIGVGALLVGSPLLVAQVWARLDYATTREARAQPVIEALAAYYAREQIYPETLAELVSQGDLGAIPSPEIGFGFLGGGPFVYQSFGVGYVLEFSAPRWVQCAYSPPWDEAEEESDTSLAREGEEDWEEFDVAVASEAEVVAAEEAEGWTCPSKPPELW